MKKCQGNSGRKSNREFGNTNNFNRRICISEMIQIFRQPKKQIKYYKKVYNLGRTMIICCSITKGQICIQKLVGEELSSIFQMDSMLGM